MRILIRDLLLAVSFGTILGWQLWERRHTTAKATKALPLDAAASTTLATRPSLPSPTPAVTTNGPVAASWWSADLEAALLERDPTLAPAVALAKSTSARLESMRFVLASTSAEYPLPEWSKP